MTQRKNNRRGGKRYQDNGPTWESHTPNAGANSTHVARARAKSKRRANRAERRTGEFKRISATVTTRERPAIEREGHEETTPCPACKGIGYLRLKHTGCFVLLPGKPWYASCGAKNIRPSGRAKNYRDVTCIECAHEAGAMMVKLIGHDELRKIAQRQRRG